MPDYAIEVDVEPDGSGFPAELARVVSRAEERQDPIEIEVSPKLTRDFAAQVRAQTRKALERIEAEVAIQAKLDRGFRAQLQREIRTAMAGVTAPIDVEPKVGPAFRRELTREVQRAAAGLRVQIEARADVGRSFRRDLQRDLRRATEGLTIKVPIEPTLNRRTRADLQRSLRTALGGRPLEVPVRLTVDARSLARLRAELAGGIGVNVRADTSSARKEIMGLGSLGSRVGSALRLALLASVAGLGIALAGAFGGAVAAAANFEEQLSSLEAVSSTTGAELAQLRQQALDAGAATVFSAREAAEAQTELSKAGATTAQILTGGLDAALSLASAGEIELAMAAEFVAKNLNTFALQGEDSARVADVLSAAANKSATDIPQMGYAISQSGLVARQFGLTIEETAGTLALFAQNGLVGSDAGTSFRTMLQRLNPQSAKARTAMKELGLEFFDSKGAFVGITSVADQLQDKLGVLTEEQRAAAIQTIFGADAARAANVVFAAGGEGIAHWTGQVTDAGNASETAATKLDNLKGDVEALKGALETVFIEAGSESTSGLRALVQSLTEIVNVSGPDVVAALTPVSTLITGLTPEIGGLTRSLAPLLEGFGAFAGPILAAVLRFFLVLSAYGGDLLTVLAPLGAVVGGVLDAFRPLVPVLAEVAAAVLLSLVPGLEALGDRDVVAALGDLAVAFGDILVAAAPLLPELVAIFLLLATQALPVLEALIPAVEVVVDVLGPLLNQLAGLAPVLLIAFALTKFVAGLRLAHGALVGLNTGLARLRASLVSTFGEQAGAKAFKGLVSAAYIASAAMAGYFAGGAEDAVTSVLSIAAAGTSIALAFAAGGPIAGAVAIGTTALGFFFGQAQKEARAAAEEQRQYNASVAALRDAFDEAGVGVASPAAQKELVVAGDLLRILKIEAGEGAKQAANLRSAFNNLGVDFETVAEFAAQGTDGLEGLNDEIDRATRRKVNIITDDMLGGLNDFGVFTDNARESALALAEELRSTYATSANSDELNRGIVTFTRDLEAGRAGLFDLAALFGDATDGAVGLEEVTSRYRDLLTASIGESDVVRYLQTLPQTTRDALVEQERLARVQQLIADEQDEARGAAIRYAEAYDEVRENLDQATGAYNRWIDSNQGAEADLAAVRLGVVDFARQARDLASDENLTGWEKQQRQIELVGQAQRDVGDAVGRFVSESNGNYDVFTQKVDTFRLETIGGLVEALDISTEEAVALTDQIFQIPSETEFSVLADTASAVSGLEDVQTRVTRFILADVSNKVALDTASPSEKMAVLDYLLTAYEGRDPQAKAFLDTLNAEQRAAFLDDLLNGIDRRVVSANVNLGFNIQTLGPGEELGRLLTGAFARGGLVDRPTLALTGEEGPELVLPLTDPERVRELLAQHAALLPDMAVAARASVSLPIDVVAQASSEPAWAPGTEGLETWVEEVVALMIGLGVRLQEEAMPTALEWEVQMVDLLTRLGLTHQATLDQMVLSTQDSTALLVATWAMAGAQMVATVQATSAGQVAALQGGLTDMANRAMLGGAGIVAALQAALSSGTAVVKVIVVGYRGELVGALNPILEAVGSPKIALARGGYVPGPDVRADIIDAKLMPREYVLTRDMAEEMGVAELEAWRRRSLRGLRTIPHFAEGGPVIGDTVGLNPEFHRRLDTWAVAQNAVYRVDSGYRDMAEQARLYQAYLAGVPGQAPAAPPGSSMHNFGLAADGSRWRDRNPGAFGLRYPMSYEPWHVEPVEARQWAAMMPDGGAMFGPLPHPPETGGKGLLSLVAGELMAHAYEQALEWAGSVTYEAAPGDLALGGSGPAREAMARLWIAEAVRLTGVPTSWIPGLLTIARRESGFDPTAINLWDSNAAKGQPSQGLMQTIPATFMRYALPGLGQILNPVHNAVAAIRYILARYGDISNVQQANPAAPPKGYAQGGMVLPDGTASVMAAFDTAAMSAQLQAPPPPPAPGGSGGNRDGGMTFEDGSVRIEVKPPDAHDPEAYAMSLGHRAPVLLAKALRRAGVG